MKSLIVISGPAGAGKSTALHALEDIGYFGIDNLPVSLLEVFATEKRSFADRVAAVMDGRDPDFQPSFDRVIEQLRRQGVKVEFLILAARENVLLSRFSQLRRPHPLYPELSLSLAVGKELEQLMPLRVRATEVIDTTGLTPHQLKGQLISLFENRSGHNGLRLALYSFGFKHGMPPEADMVLDVRFLPNPFFVPELQNKTGLEPKVADYVLENEAANDFFSHFMPFLDFLLPQYRKEGKASFSIAVGCTGGKHRSVAIVEQLQRRLAAQGIFAKVWHRELPAP